MLALRDDSPPVKLVAQRPLVLKPPPSIRLRVEHSRASARARGSATDGPSDIVVAGRSAWVLLPSEQRLLRVDARTHELTSALRLPWIPLGSLATAGGFVWAAQDDGPELARVSVASGRLERVRPNDTPSTGLTAGDDNLWVATDGLLTEVVPVNGSAGRRIPYNGSGRVTFGDGALWSLEGPACSGRSTRRPAACSRRPTPATVTDVAVADGLVWASVVPDGVVYGLDEDDLRVRRKLAAGADPERISFAGGRLWVANSAARTVTSVDPRRASDACDHRCASGGGAYRDGVVWAPTVPEPPPLPPAGGPELRLSLPGDYLTLDPARLALDRGRAVEAATCAGLLAYPDTAGPAGSALRPEVAAAMPRSRDGGRTYTFRIRSGFRFSPPSNETVTAATFKRTLERAFSPKIGHGGQGPCEAPAIAGLPPSSPARRPTYPGSGREATRCRSRCRAVRRLPDPLSLPYLCPVRRPCRSARAPTRLPSSGPYFVSSTADGRSCCCRTPATAASGRGGGHGSSTRSTSDAARRGARRPRLARLPAGRLRQRLAALAPSVLERRYGRRARPHGGAASATSSRRARSSTTSS